VCGKAKTGSGKTLAFGLPLLARVEQSTPGRPRALVLVPTRELAGQVTEVLEPLASAVDRKLIAVYGGASMTRQITQLTGRVDVVIIRVA
jgi:superfamily II DNA/RNA helicase